MSYVFDTSPLSVLFKNYYRRRFPTLWVRFDALVGGGAVISVREVLREIEDSSIKELRGWAEDQRHIFGIPSRDEAGIVSGIYGVQHFQQNIELQKILKGGKNADPFVIAKAQVENRTVVTMEIFKENANICRHFGIACMTLEEFMEAEGWVF